MSDDRRADQGVRMAELVLPEENGCGRSGPQEKGAELPTPEESTVPGLVEMLLKNPRKADLYALAWSSLADVLPRLLGIALASYALFGLTLLVLLNYAPAEAYPHQLLRVPPAHWLGRSGLGLVTGYTVGLVAASGLCLPTFYFFALLAGVRLSMLQITAVVVRAKAAAAIVLVGILPIYLALMLGLLIFEAPATDLEFCFYLGLALPFLAGLEGVHCIYRGVQTLSAYQPEEWRTQRFCFLRRLTLSWSACYTVVSPVMVYRLWEMIGRG